MKENKILIKTLFVNSLIKNNLTSNSEIYAVDLIHQNKNNKNKILLGKSCCEYLKDSHYRNDNLIVPIPLDKCFINVKLNSDKLLKIKEYVDYLNSTNLFKYELINNEESKLNLDNLYFNKSINFDLKNELNSKFIMFSSKKNVNYSESENDFRYEMRDLNLNSIIYTKLLFNVKKLLNAKYKHLIVEKSNKNLFLNNKRRYKFNNYFNTYISLLTNVENGNLHDIKTHGFKFDQLFKNEHTLKREFLISEMDNSSFLMPINEDEKYNLDYKNLISDILLLKSNLLLESSKNEKSYKDNVNYYNSISEFINIIKSDKLETVENIKLDSLINSVNENFIYIKINNDNDIKLNDKLLLQFTLIRYLYYGGYNHLPDVILKFKNNVKKISLLDNLSLSCQFHKNTAWNRYNIMDCKSSDFIGKFKHYDTKYYFLNKESDILHSLSSKNNNSNINGIFSPENNLMIENNKELTIKFYKFINDLYSKNEFSEIYSIFKLRIKFKKVVKQLNSKSITIKENIDKIKNNKQCNPFISRRVYRGNSIIQSRIFR